MSVVDATLAFLDRPEVGRAIAAGALVAARLAPLTILAPVFGLRSAPASIRSGVVVALTLALTPVALGSAEVPPTPLLGLAIVREALVGSIFAIVSSVPFHALEASGRLVDLHRGANLADVIAPPTGERTSPSGDLALLAGLALFASIGGIRWTIGAFAESLVDLPIGRASLETTVFLEAAHALTDACRFAAIAAAPATVAILVADLGLGLVARTVPRISVFFVGMPILLIPWIASISPSTAAHSRSDSCRGSRPRSPT